MTFGYTRKDEMDSYRNSYRDVYIHVNICVIIPHVCLMRGASVSDILVMVNMPYTLVLITLSLVLWHLHCGPCSLGETVFFSLSDIFFSFSLPSGPLHPSVLWLHLKVGIPLYNLRFRIPG